MIAWGLASVLLLAGGWPAPLREVNVIGYPNEGAAQRVALSAAGAAGSGDLGSTYHVDWTRTGDTMEVGAERQDAGQYWRLALEARFDPCSVALTWDYESLPLRLPLAGVQPAWFYWYWNPGLPRRLVGDLGPETAGLVLQSTSHHGFFLSREHDGTFVAQLCLDAWQPGDLAKVRFRVLEGQAARAWPVAPPVVCPNPPAALPRGFVKVNPTHDGFVTPDGQPWTPLGRNVADLVARSDAEQEAILHELLAHHLNVVRILLHDACFHPLPDVTNTAALARLRPTLDRCAAHGIRVIVCLEYSGAGNQYQRSVHRTPCWSDLYFTADGRRWYEEQLEQVVKPLRDHPAVLAWDATNEPAVEPNPRSVVQPAVFSGWMKRRDPDDLRALLPGNGECEQQSTPAAREFFACFQPRLAAALVDRARRIRAADANHLITLSAGDPRLLRGTRGAEVFDFWAPHTYDLWVNGPVIDHHARFLAASLRDALPDRPRPVVIEEFGISAGPKFPDALRTEHVRQYLAAARAAGLAGLLHWYDLSPAMLDAYAAAAGPWPAATPPTRQLAVYVPPSQEWRLVYYPQWPARRRWEAAVATFTAQGWGLRFVATPAEAHGCQAVLALGDSLTPAEAAVVRACGLPIHILKEAPAVRAALPTALDT